MMIRSLITTLAFLFYFTASGQMSISNKTKASPLDQSPLDMAYYPSDYTVLKSQDKMKDPPVARVIFSRPQKNKRVIFGELIEYGVVWRLGANEATEIEFYKDVRIGGKKINKGRYTLYALVNENVWTMILNKDTDIWGAFKYDQKKDVLRIEVKTEKQADITESYSMYFEKSTEGANLFVVWDNIKATLPIGF